MQRGDDIASVTEAASSQQAPPAPHQSIFQRRRIRVNATGNDISGQARNELRRIEEAVKAAHGSGNAWQRRYDFLFDEFEYFPTMIRARRGGRGGFNGGRGFPGLVVTMSF